MNLFHQHLLLKLFFLALKCVCNLDVPLSFILVNLNLDTIYPSFYVVYCTAFGSTHFQAEGANLESFLGT